MTLSRKNVMLASSIIQFIAVSLLCLLLIQIIVVTPVHALTRYYNCIARVANKNATLSLSNVNNCYNMIFKGALHYYGIKPPNDIQANYTNPHNTEKQVNNHVSDSQVKVMDKSQNIFG